MNLTILSKIPWFRSQMQKRLCQNVKDSFDRGNTVTVFFAEQYYLRDFKTLENALAVCNPNWEIGYITVNTGNGLMTVFFVAQTFQALWDGVSVYKHALRNQWLAYHIHVYMRILYAEACRRNIPLLTDVLGPAVEETSR